MKNKHTYAQGVINSLCDEKRYEFTLTGKFEDVIGNHFKIFSHLFVYVHIAVCLFFPEKLRKKYSNIIRKGCFAITIGIFYR